MYILWNLSQPQNRTMNIVLHGYAVPAGFFKPPVVNAESSYPTLQLKKLPGHVFL